MEVKSSSFLYLGEGNQVIDSNMKLHRKFWTTIFKYDKENSFTHSYLHQPKKVHMNLMSSF